MRLSDIIGRKKVVVASVLVGSVCLLGICLSPNITVLYIFIFIFGLSCAPRGLSYVYALELTTKDKESIYATIAMLFDSSCMIILGIYFYIFRNMNHIIIFVIIVQTIAIILVMIYCPESPK